MNALLASLLAASQGFGPPQPTYEMSPAERLVTEVLEWDDEGSRADAFTTEESQWSYEPNLLDDSATTDETAIFENKLETSAGGTACRGACLAAGLAACRLLIAACAGTTVITVGSTTIPCTSAAFAACLANQFGVAACVDHCPP